jgi:rhamnosyltransferase
MTVQDAWTEDPQLLERMVIHFNDSEVMGVCGQQIVPHELDKNPHEWFRPQNKPSVKTIQFKPGSFEKLSPKEQRFSCGWDDVIAMYRKSALIATPFEPLIFGEDMLWAKTALEKGYKLVYDTSARVNHYHYQFQDFTRKRVLITKLFIYKVFNFKDYEKTPIKNYFLVIYRTLKWRIHPKWILHNFSIIYQHRKATKEFIDAVESNLLIQLEEELSLNIPKGQSIKKSISHAK